MTRDYARLKSNLQNGICIFDIFPRSVIHLLVILLYACSRINIDEYGHSASSLFDIVFNIMVPEPMHGQLMIWGDVLGFSCTITRGKIK